MESLALLVSLLILGGFSGAFIALALSFVPNRIGRGFVYVFVALSSTLMTWIAIAANSSGAWFMAIGIVGLDVVAVWNAQRVKRENEPLNPTTNE